MLVRKPAVANLGVDRFSRVLLTQPPKKGEFPRSRASNQTMSKRACATFGGFQRFFLIFFSYFFLIFLMTLPWRSCAAAQLRSLRGHADGATAGNPSGKGSLGHLSEAKPKTWSLFFWWFFRVFNSELIVFSWFIWWFCKPWALLKSLLLGTIF